MYIYIYIKLYIYIYVYTCIYVYIYTYMYMFPYLFITPENTVWVFALKKVFQMLAATLRCAAAEAAQ